MIYLYLIVMAYIVKRKIIMGITAKTTNSDFVVQRNLDDILLGLGGRVVPLNLLINLVVQKHADQVTYKRLIKRLLNVRIIGSYSQRTSDKN